MSSCTCKETQSIFSGELQQFIQVWKDKPGSLIMILHKAQEEYSYLPSAVIAEVAKCLKLSYAQVYGVATFYHFFKLTAPGRHVISVCTGTACYLKGAEDLLQELKQRLHVDLNEPTEDGCFSIETVRCIGCCGLAPVVSVDGEVFGRVQKKDITKILAKFRDESPKGEKVETRLFSH